MSVDFAAFGIARFLDAAHGACLEAVAFFEQFIDALRVGVAPVGESLQVAGKRPRVAPWTLGRERGSGGL